MGGWACGWVCEWAARPTAVLFNTTLGEKYATFAYVEKLQKWLIMLPIVVLM